MRKECLIMYTMSDSSNIFLITIVLPIHWLGNARNRTIELLFYVIVSLYQRNSVLTVHTADMTTKTKQNKN